MKRLKNLTLTRVDLVPAGANPGAHIKMFKAAKKTEDGQQFASGDYAYAPDESEPSTWKLRLTSEPGGKPDARMVSAAIAALGKGSRSQKVNIPNDELPSVREKVLRAWKQLRGDDSTEIPGVLKMESESAQVDAMQKELDEAKAQLAEVEKAKAAESESVQKALEDTRAELEAIRKEQRSREFVEKAQDFASLGDAAQIGSLLEAADSHFGDAEKETLNTLLRSAAEQVEKGLLFKRLSQDSPEPQSWEAKLSQAARDRVAKGESATVEQAKVEIMKTDPGLRRDYADSRKVN